MFGMFCLKPIPIIITAMVRKMVREKGGAIADDANHYLSLDQQ